MTKKRTSEVPLERYKKLLEHMDEAVWMGDGKERTIYANPKFLRMVGYTLEEVLGRESYIFWDPESAARVKNENVKRKKGVVSEYDGDIVTKKGELIPVHLRGTPTPDGGTIGIMTDMREILKSKKNETILYSALEHSFDGVLITDIDHKIIYLNRGFERMFGFTQAELLGKDAFLLLPDYKWKKQEIDKIRATVSEKGYIGNLETVRKTKKGYSIDVSLTESIIRNEKGGIIGFSIIYHDITSRKKWQTELKGKYERLKSAYEMLGQRQRQIDYLSELIELLVTNKNKPLIYDTMTAQLCMFSRADACVLRLLDSKKKILNMVSVYGLSSEYLTKSRLAFGGSLAEKAFRTRRPLKIIDLFHEKLYRSPNLIRRFNLEALLLIPLIKEDELLGTVSLYVKEGGNLDVLDNDFIPVYIKHMVAVLSKI